MLMLDISIPSLPTMYFLCMYISAMKVTVLGHVCVCVCGGENERGRKESMGERDVATETGGGLVRVIKA